MKIFVITSGGTGLKLFHGNQQGGINFLLIICNYFQPRDSTSGRMAIVTF